MVNVIGVRFRQAGKVYYFDPGSLVFKRGDHVIVETARGVEYGEVILGNHEVEEIKVIQPLRTVMRAADEADRRHEAENCEKQKEAFRICREKIRKHQLDMKLIGCEYTFDNSKILFYFTAEGRIDFRELVKDLASVFRTRIELRQVGVRDETKLLGGIGICGRQLCCNSYLSDFIPVSIKMAKEQNLSLNPTKISGVCGRLMCCLKNEEDVYESLNRRLPNIGDLVLAPDGLSGEVQSVSILKQLVKVVVDLPHDEKEIREYPVEELQFKPRQRREKGRRADRGAERDDSPALSKDAQQDEKTLEMLERLEKMDGREEKGSGEKPAGGGRAARQDGQEERNPRGNRERRIRKRGAGENREERRAEGERRERRAQSETRAERPGKDREQTARRERAERPLRAAEPEAGANRENQEKRRQFGSRRQRDRRRQDKRAAGAAEGGAGIKEAKRSAGSDAE